MLSLYKMEKTEDKINKLHSEGKTIRQIATELNLGRTKVHLTIRRNIVKPESIPEEIKSPTLVIEEDRMDSNLVETYMNDIQTHIPLTKEAIKDNDKKEKKDVENKEKGVKFVESLLDKIEKKRNEKVKPAREVKEKIVKIVENPEDKADVITRITFNVSNFGSLLTGVIGEDKDAFLKSLLKKSLPELELTLKLLENQRIVSNIANQMKHLLFMGTSFLEIGSKQFLKIQSDGYSNAIQQRDKEIEMILRELCMNNVSKLEKIQRPELRLVTILTTTLLAIDMKNRQAGKVPVNVLKTNEDLKNEYNDL